MTGKYLITTDNYFLAPNGQHFQGVWGEVEILTDDILGVKTNRMSTNWFAKVGTAENHVIIAGCQIHYAVKCEERPYNRPYNREEIHEGELRLIPSPSRIYFTE